MSKILENKFKVGDKVLLQLGVDRKYAPTGLKRWDGCRFRVEEVHLHSSNAQNSYYTYYLKCCRSIYGTSYTIAEDWLTRMI